MFPWSGNIETVVLLSHKKPDGHINVKVEFGEGEGKVPLDNIAKRAESYTMKKNVKRFVSMTMAMLVAAGSLAGKRLSAVMHGMS